MALKRKISKAEHAALADHLKAEYIEDGDEFRLDIEGDEDTGALKRSKDRESQLRKDAEAKLRQAQEELDRINGDDARKAGDIATLEKAWQKKLDDANKQAAEKQAAQQAFITRSLVDAKALEIASAISVSPALMLPHIKARLQASFEEGADPKTVVLDATGKPSALTVDELCAELRSNKDFAPILKGTNASGGAAGSKPAGGAADNSNQSANFAAMNPKDLAAQIAAKKANQE